MLEYLLLYILSIVLYFLLLRQSTISDSGFSINDNADLFTALIIMIVPFVNLLIIIFMINELYFNIKIVIPKKLKLKKPLYKYILFIK